MAKKELPELNPEPRKVPAMCVNFPSEQQKTKKARLALARYFEADAEVQRAMIARKAAAAKLGESLEAMKATGEDTPWAAHWRNNPPKS